MRRYTLLELLIAVTAVALAAVVLVQISQPTCRGGSTSRARADLNKLRVAIAMYQADTGQLPRPRYARASPDLALRDAAPSLYVALTAPKGQGGGPAGPYLPYVDLGVVLEPAALQADRMGTDGLTGVRALTQREQELGRALGADAGKPHVFVDPWGNPFHYREWASVPGAQRDELRKLPPLRTRFSSPRPLKRPLIKQTQDFPRADTFELWSNGPNGVNEYGDPFSDDIVSWRE